MDKVGKYLIIEVLGVACLITMYFLKSPYKILIGLGGFILIIIGTMNIMKSSKEQRVKKWKSDGYY